MATGEQVASLPGHRNGINCVVSLTTRGRSDLSIYNLSIRPTLCTSHTAQHSIELLSAEIYLYCLLENKKKKKKKTDRSEFSLTSSQRTTTKFGWKEFGDRCSEGRERMNIYDTDAVDD